MVVVILDIFVLSKYGKKSSRSAELVTDVKRPGREGEGGGHSLFGLNRYIPQTGYSFRDFESPEQRFFQDMMSWIKRNGGAAQFTWPLLSIIFQFDWGFNMWLFWKWLHFRLRIFPWECAPLRPPSHPPVCYGYVTYKDDWLASYEITQSYNLVCLPTFPVLANSIFRDYFFKNSPSMPIPLFFFFVVLWVILSFQAVSWAIFDKYP